MLAIVGPLLLTRACNSCCRPWWMMQVSEYYFRWVENCASAYLDHRIDDGRTFQHVGCAVTSPRISQQTGEELELFPDVPLSPVLVQDLSASMFVAFPEPWKVFAEWLPSADPLFTKIPGSLTNLWPSSRPLLWRKLFIRWGQETGAVLTYPTLPSPYALAIHTPIEVPPLKGTVIDENAAPLFVDDVLLRRRIVEDDDTSHADAPLFLVRAVCSLSASLCSKWHNSSLPVRRVVIAVVVTDGPHHDEHVRQPACPGDERLAQRAAVPLRQAHHRDAWLRAPLHLREHRQVLLPAVHPGRDRHRVE